VKCYKGFDKDLKCRGFQYEIGKEYEENTADICHKDFHACENPMDVFGYYNPADSRYCEVDLDTNEQTVEDSKRVGKKIKIETEIGLSGLIQAGVKFILEKVDFKSAKESNTGDWSAATNTGDRSAATNTGDWSAATVGGAESIAVVTGYGSKAKGAVGCWLVLTERDEKMHILGVQAVCVDGETIKADTFYMLKNGAITEVDE
jgi:hypothetical protein